MFAVIFQLMTYVEVINGIFDTPISDFETIDTCLQEFGVPAGAISKSFKMPPSISIYTTEIQRLGKATIPGLEQTSKAVRPFAGPL